jgi:hypothetical protein
MFSPQRFPAGLIAACLLPLILSGCMAQVRGSGVPKTEKRDVADFTEVEVSGAVQLDLTVGPATSLEVTADDNIVPHVVTDVKGGRLKVYVDASTSTSLGVKVKATAPALNAFDGSGATKTTLTGVKGKQFKLDLSGASKCTLTGEADRLTVDCSGASNVDAAGLTAQAVDATVSGASTAEVRATKELKAEASGASTVRYVGSPDKLEKHASGASTIAPK